jgi:hypothetical protein
LRNDSDCKDVVLWNTSKRYAVIDSSDFTKNIFWLASCFSKKKKPNRHCLGNQSAIAGVCIFDTIDNTRMRCAVIEKSNPIRFFVETCSNYEIYFPPQPKN